MDLRRWGEFAFGIGVLMCGGAFLLLAIERFEAPVVAGVPVAMPVVVASTANTVASVVRPRSKVAPVVIVRLPRVAVRPRSSHVVSAPAHLKLGPIVATVATPLKRIGDVHARKRVIAAIATRMRHPRTVEVRRPQSEATPEPPIGYDDHQVLVRSDGPSAAMPTMEPVQVELTTTHLGH